MQVIMPETLKRRSDSRQGFGENPRKEARKVGQWEANSQGCFSQSNVIEGTVEDLKFLMEKHLRMETETAANV
jgi:hypothetical protein